MPNHFRFRSFRFHSLRLPLFILLSISGASLSPAYADTPASETEQQQSWLDSTLAACAQQFSAEQCRDDEFLEQHYHVRDLQTAHRAAMRRSELEQRALRELLLQRSCGNTAAYCSGDATTDCAAQLQQMCAAITQQAAACVSEAAQYCAASGQSSDCLKQRQPQCPSAKKQSIDELLVKYSKLTLQQQMHVRQVAQQIDANQDSSWIGNLFRWLGF